MKQLSVTVHEIAVDGLPGMEALTGRVVFLFDGCLVSGWPLPRDRFPGLYLEEVVDALWEGDTDVSHSQMFSGVTHWVELPVPAWEIPALTNEKPT